MRRREVVNRMLFRKWHRCRCRRSPIRSLGDCAWMHFLFTVSTIHNTLFIRHHFQPLHFCNPKVQQPRSGESLSSYKHLCVLWHSHPFPRRPTLSCPDLISSFKRIATIHRHRCSQHFFVWFNLVYLVVGTFCGRGVCSHSSLFNVLCIISASCVVCNSLLTFFYQFSFSSYLDAVVLCCTTAYYRWVHFFIFVKLQPHTDTKCHRSNEYFSLSTCAPYSLFEFLDAFFLVVSPLLLRFWIRIFLCAPSVVTTWVHIIIIFVPTNILTLNQPHSLCARIQLFFSLFIFRMLLLLLSTLVMLTPYVHSVWMCAPILIESVSGTTLIIMM